MKYDFNSVKTVGKISRIVAPLMQKCDYSVNISTQNFICETVSPDEVCSSVSINIHDNNGIVLSASVNNWTDPKENRKTFKEIKEFVKNTL